MFIVPDIKDIFWYDSELSVRIIRIKIRNKFGLIIVKFGKKSLMNKL